MTPVTTISVSAECCKATKTFHALGFGEWFNVKFDIGKSVAIRVFNENAKLHDDRKKSDFDFAKYFHPELF